MAAFRLITENSNPCVTMHTVPLNHKKAGKNRITLIGFYVRPFPSLHVTQHLNNVEIRFVNIFFKLRVEPLCH